MLGLINDCAEQLVIQKFGIDAWHAIKEAAGCPVKDHGFEQHGHYPDSATVDIVVAAAEALSVTVDDVLELFGQFFLEYTIEKGYDNLLRCQGSTLRLWLSNLNAMHDHLQSSLPAGNFPVFWCEDCTTEQGSIILHYYSVRGALLSSVVVGITKEVAKTYFDVEIRMDKLATQGEDGSECTTWRISSVDPEKRYKLTQQDPTGSENEIVKNAMDRRAALRDKYRMSGSSAGSAPSLGVCPFSGSKSSIGSDEEKKADGGGHSSSDELVRLKMLQRMASSEKIQRSSSAEEEESAPGKCPFSSAAKVGPHGTSLDRSGGNTASLGLPPAKVRAVFPYHVMVDSNFKILQVGKALPEILLRDTSDLIGRPVGDVLTIVKPILAGWDWPTLQRLADQKIYLTPVPFDDIVTGAYIEQRDVKFKGNMIQMSGDTAMFVLSPDAENIHELSGMGLTMSDLPLHSFQRDVVFLGEHIASEVKTAHKLDRLSKRLNREKELSNTLLNSMLPATVSESLRAGKTVEPRLYEDVTLFFSDVVGFTNICDAVEPWDVIDMLNQLYTVMDHLASHFNLYKVETIGDAYMCCSGLPTPDEKHAQNIANFAIAVSECVHLITSPSDGEPLQLRIGIHTGHCMGGVVGTLTPHYCLFGDMVNTTARHESTGIAGRIQCSNVLYENLAEHSADSEGPMYKFTTRGYVDMKGKGKCYTYWLDGGSEHNEISSPAAIETLREEVVEVLSKKKWKKRKYFDFRRRRSSIAGYNDNTDDMTVASARLLDDERTYVSQQSSHVADQSEGMTDSMDEVEDRSEGNVRMTKATNDAESTIAASATSDVREQSLGGNSSDHDTISFYELKRTRWTNIKWDPDLSRIELVASIHGLLSSMLWKCCAEVSSQMPDNKAELDHELLRYVDRVSDLYDAHPFHSFEHAAQVTLSATHLVNEYNKAKQDLPIPHESNPFTRFITVFAALIHDVKHLGCPNAQLQKENHPLNVVYSQGSYQERQSIQVALAVFLEEFSVLSTTILKLCPDFLHMVTAAVLATDVSNKETQAKIKERFKRIIIEKKQNVTEFDKTQTCIEQMLLLADVGHCTQGYDNFLIWNQAFFYECLQNHYQGHADDPRPGWHAGEIGFLEFYILPLAERCNAIIPSCHLAKGTRQILRRWNKDGIEWTENLAKRTYATEKAEKERKTPTARAVTPKRKVRKPRFSLFGRKSSKQSKEAVLADEIVEECPKDHLNGQVPVVSDIPPIDNIRATRRVSFSGDSYVTTDKSVDESFEEHHDKQVPLNDISPTRAQRRGSFSEDTASLDSFATPEFDGQVSEANEGIPLPSIIRAQRRLSFSGGTASYSHATSQRRVSFSGDTACYSHATSQRRVSFSGDTASYSHATSAANDNLSTGATQPKRRVSFSGDTALGGGDSSRDSSSPLGDSVQTPLGDPVQSHIIMPGSA